MGMEVESKQADGAGDDGKEVLLVFYPTGESEERNIDVTPRMMDLALMGFLAVAITRWDPKDTRYYTICGKEGLSECLRNAVLNETGSLVREALKGSEPLN